MDSQSSWHRRPLPATLVPFSSDQGRRLFREALEAGSLEAFFPLIEQFHTQADPAFCGLGSLVMALNALGVDPGRVWRGPWRWFSEELLDCCTPLARVQVTGLSLDEVACLARCNGAEAELARATERTLEQLRAEVAAVSAAQDRVLIASYLRSTLGQTGAGHFSPIGGYHAGRDMVLLLDVARFKYPPHWVPLVELFEAMRGIDPVTQRARGWVGLRRRAGSSAVAQFLICADGLATREPLERALALQREGWEQLSPASLAGVVQASAAALTQSGLLERVRVREPQTPEQRAVFEQLRGALARAASTRVAVEQLGATLGLALSIFWLALPAATFAALPAPLAARMAELVDLRQLSSALIPELELLRSQIEFLLEHQPARPVGAPSDEPPCAAAH